LTGGKAAALSKMLAAGLPIPEGFVVTTKAFSESGFSISPRLSNQLEKLRVNDRDEIEVISAKVRESILKNGLNEDLSGAINLAYEELGDQLNVSVRSSAVAEDLPTASFAGQYATHLNVSGIKEILTSILEVWASLYSPQALSYRLMLDLPPDVIKMAVLVQKQLRPDASGVVFTQDPVTGESGRLTVNVSLGLGEGVVAGLVPSDTFIISKNEREIISREVNSKTEKVDLAPQIGSRLVSVNEDIQKLPALTDPQLSDLHLLSDQVGRLFAVGQDIEFALENDRLWVLQSRPITGLPELSAFPLVWEDPQDATYTWSRFQFGARGPYLRLQEDWFRAFARWQKVCFDVTGSPRARNSILKFFNGYGYGRSPEVDEDELTRRQDQHARLVDDYIKRGTSLYEAVIGPQVEKKLNELARFKHKRASLSDLYEHLERCIEAFGETMGDLHWRMIGGRPMDWPTTYQEITGEYAVASGALLQAIPNKTTQLVRRLRRLAQIVQSDPALSFVFHERRYHEINNPNAAHDPTRGLFQILFKGLLAHYGFRTGLGFGSPASFTDPTWNMDPRQPLEIIRTYTLQDIATLEKMEKRAQQSRRYQTHRVRQSLEKEPELLRRFDEALLLAIAEVKRMENHNHIMEQGVAGVAREAIEWMGQGLSRKAFLQSPDEVFHLSLGEIRALSNDNKMEDFKEHIQDQRKKFEERSAMRVPSTIGLPPSKSSSQVIVRPGFDQLPNAGIDGLILRGTGAAPGKARGPAKVVPMTSMPPEINKGDILVAQNVGPAWTPILPLISGMVLDGGAVFQHSALVCREYGIPAVLMTRDATQVIVDGQEILVDADEGIVHLVPR
jgi:phosphohistidine swiveling domain-containing protein